MICAVAIWIVAIVIVAVHWTANRDPSNALTGRIGQDGQMLQFPHGTP